MPSVAIDEIAAEARGFGTHTDWDGPIRDTHSFGGTTLFAASDYARSFAELFAAGRTPVHGHLSLARSTLETSVVAAWLNDPAVDPGERVRHGLCEQLYNASELVRLGLEPDAKQRLQRWKDVAAGFGDRIKRVAERFNLAAERARSRDMRIGYHNHFWEFGTDFDGRSGLEVFFELVEPDVFAEIDLYWARVGGRDPVELITSLGSRVLLLHAKDGDGAPGTPSCAFGDGVVDLPRALETASSAMWHVVELEGLDETDIWPALDQSRRYLIDRGLSATRDS